MLNVSEREVNLVIKTAKYIALHDRFPSSPHHRTVGKFIEKVLKELGNVKTQTFEKDLLKPLKGEIKVLWGGVIKGFPYTNSPSGKVNGVAVDCGYGTNSEIARLDLRGKIAVVREGKKPFKEKEKFLYQKGVKGIIVFHPEVEEIYNGISAGKVPVISIKPSEVLDILDKEVQLYSQTEKVRVKGKNLWVEFGKGEYNLTFVAHYDTKPNTKGAIDNGLSVAILLWLAAIVAKAQTKLNYRVRFLFTDLEEYGLEGAKHFVNALTPLSIRSSFVVAVDTVGWHNPAVLVSDGDGRNSSLMLLIANQILEDLNIREEFDFTDGKSGRSDHIPFRRRGAKTLFLASNPFPLRHTVLDNEYAIIPDKVKLWMKFLKRLALSFDKYLKEEGRL